MENGLILRHWLLMKSLKNIIGTERTVRYMQKARNRIQGNQTGTESSYRRVLLREIGGKERCTAPF